MNQSQNAPQNQSQNQSLTQLFLRFLRFGLLAWGGPVAQIAMIRQELVEEEKWISKERFNRVLAVYQALPGPEAHELCVYFGTQQAGRIGGLLAGLAFMLPGFLLILLLSWVYVTYGITSPFFVAAFSGMQPAVVALIVRGLQRISGHALQNGWLWGIAIAALGLQLVGVNFVVVLLAAGLFYWLLCHYQWKSGLNWASLNWTSLNWASLSWGSAIGILFLLGIGLWHYGIARQIGVATSTDALSTSSVSPSSVTIFGSGLRTGLLTFGGAYSAIGFLRQDAVLIGQWLTDKQFLDGIALGGILPAPLIIFGTFVGYLAGGLLGAILMTLGIFLPAFSFSLIGHEIIEKLIDLPWLHHFLDGVTAGVVGIIAATALTLLQTTVTTPITALIFGVALFIVIRWKSKASTPVAVLVGAAIAIVASFVGK